MCPSTETSEAQRQFAAVVLRNLLHHIDDQNDKGRDPFLVSHAWTKGPMMYLVYRTPPSDITLGLVRDTRESNISPGPWLSVDEAVQYYYITDLEEGGGAFGQSGGPKTIWWHGYPLLEDLPEHPSDIPDAYRYTPATAAPSARHSPKEDQPHQPYHPRRYADPL
jgi:hypothetical protein